MVQEAKQEETKQEVKKLEFKLSSVVTALVDAVEDMSKHRPALGVVHLEKDKAVVADGFALVQVEDETIPLADGAVLNIPLAVLRPHRKRDVTVTVPEDGHSTVSISRNVKGITHKTEAQLPAINYPPSLRAVVDNALDNTYSSYVALDIKELKSLLKLFDTLSTTQTEVRFYIPKVPTSPIMLVMRGVGRYATAKVRALLMPRFVDWSVDGVKKEEAEGIKYEEKES